jgi:hypothetical protein
MNKVIIGGNEYSVRELTLPEKMQVMKDVFPLVKDFYSSQTGGEITVSSLLELGASLLQCAENIIMTLLRISVPDYSGDFGSLPESALREATMTVFDVNDFGGCMKHFLELGRKIASSMKS